MMFDDVLAALWRGERIDLGGDHVCPGCGLPAPGGSSIRACKRCRAVLNERECCAKIAESWADNYPEDVFPPLGLPPAATIDRVAAQANRHAARMIAAKIREGVS